MQRTIRAFGCLAIVLLTSASCGLFRTPEDGGFREREVLVRIENQNFYDVTVWASHNGDRRRLGSVPGNTTRVFPMAWSPAPVSFEVRLLAGRTFRTRPFSMSPGEDIIVTIPPDTHTRE